MESGNNQWIWNLHPSLRLYSKCVSLFTRLSFGVLSQSSRALTFAFTLLTIIYVNLLCGSLFWLFICSLSPSKGRCMSSPLHLCHYRVSSGQLITRSNCTISVLVFLNLMAVAPNFFKMLLKFSLDSWDIFFLFHSFESFFFLLSTTLMHYIRQTL